MRAQAALSLLKRLCEGEKSIKGEAPVQQYLA
jgi:hypothetical protein